MDRPVLTVTELSPLLVEGTERPRIAAASGIVYVGSWLHVVSDDEHYLRSWRLPWSGPGTATRYFDGELPSEPAARKAAKADVEVLFLLDVADRRVLVGLGSGSTARRRAGFAFRIANDGRIDGAAHAFDAGDLYDQLEDDLGPPNVEGAAQVGGVVILLLRSSTGANRVARLDVAMFDGGVRAGSVLARALIDVVPCRLGELRGVPLGFTDATAIDGRIWFSAAAEVTDNAYDDGPVAGSVIGRLDEDRLGASEAWELDFPGGKVEGLACMDTGDGTVALWLVTDSDDELEPSLLLQCSVPLR